VTGIQPAEELLPIVKQNPARFAFLANVNPHLHYPVAGELARQLALGAVGLKVHPVHGGFSAADPMLYPAYQVCAEASLPVVVHCGTSSFPGSDNSLAAPDHLLPVLRHRQRRLGRANRASGLANSNSAARRASSR